MTIGTAPALPVWRKVAFGAGDFGFNFSWQFTSVFLLYYYTDVLGLSPAVAGSIYMLALVWDAAVDPVIGEITERTRTRFGRFRPYLIFGAFPLAVTIAALTVVPGAFPAAVAMAAGITHVLFRTAFAFVNIPYSAMMARITRNPHDRSDLASLRMIFGNLAGIVVAMTVHPAVARLGGGDDARGWGLFCVALGVFTTFFLWLAAWATRGVDAPEPRHGWDAGARVPITRQLLRALAALNNRAFLVVAGTILVANFTLVFFQKTLIYWFEHGLHDKAASGPALAVPGVVALVCIPGWNLLIRRFAKHHIAMAAGVLGIAGSMLFLLVGRSSVEGAIVAIVVWSVGSAGSVVASWAMVPDTVEYGEWRRGVRNEGLTFGMIMLMIKASLGFGAGALGFALAGIGYQPHQVQSEATVRNLLLLMTLIPAAGLVLKLVLLTFYPMTHARFDEIQVELADRAAAAA